MASSSSYKLPKLNIENPRLARVSSRVPGELGSREINMNLDAYTKYSEQLLKTLMTPARSTSGGGGGGAGGLKGLSKKEMKALAAEQERAAWDAALAEHSKFLFDDSGFGNMSQGRRKSWMKDYLESDAFQKYLKDTFGEDTASARRYQTALMRPFQRHYDEWQERLDNTNLDSIWRNLKSGALDAWDSLTITRPRIDAEEDLAQLTPGTQEYAAKLAEVQNYRAQEYEAYQRHLARNEDNIANNPHFIEQIRARREFEEEHGEDALFQSARIAIDQGDSQILLDALASSLPISGAAMVTGAATGLAAGSVVPGAGNAVGGIVGGIAGAMTGGLMGYGAGGQQAAYEIYGQDEAAMMQNEEYKTLRNQGLDHLAAQQELIARGGQMAAWGGAASEALSGAVNPAMFLTKAGGSLLGSGLRAGLGRAALQTVEEAGSEFIAEAGNQLTQNIARQQSLNDGTDTWDGVLAAGSEGATLGAIMGAPFAGGGAFRNYTPQTRNTNAGNNTTGSSSTQTTPPPAPTGASATAQNLVNQAMAAAGAQQQTPMQQLHNWMAQNANNQVTPAQFMAHAFPHLQAAAASGVNISNAINSLQGLANQMPNGNFNVQSAYNNWLKQNQSSNTTSAPAPQVNTRTAADGSTQQYIKSPGAGYDIQITPEVQTLANELLKQPINNIRRAYNNLHKQMAGSTTAATENQNLAYAAAAVALQQAELREAANGNRASVPSNDGSGAQQTDTTSTDLPSGTESDTAGSNGQTVPDSNQGTVRTGAAATSTGTSGAAYENAGTNQGTPSNDEAVRTGARDGANGRPDSATNAETGEGTDTGDGSGAGQTEQRGGANEPTAAANAAEGSQTSVAAQFQVDHPRLWGLIPGVFRQSPAVLQRLSDLHERLTTAMSALPNFYAKDGNLDTEMVQTLTDNVLTMHANFAARMAAVGVNAVDYLNRINFDAMATQVNNAAERYNQIAYHGTPHRFDNFSLEAIGTGEGHQAHGWGLYFAGNRGVSEGYREQLRDSTTGNLMADQLISMTESADTPPSGEQFLADVREIIKKLENLGGAETLLAEYREAYELLSVLHNENKLVLGKARLGQVFRVNIPESDVLIDEDLPFSEQPQKVQEALLKLSKEKNYNSILARAIAEDEYGDTLYKRAGIEAHLFDTDIEAGSTAAAIYGSKTLNTYGIKGITYDGRDDGRCFVIFDDKAIDIVETYYQTERGYVDMLNGEYYVNLLGNADASTVLHESGHIFLEEMHNAYNQSLGDAQFRQDYETLRDWLGIENGQITTEQHEQFARGFEQYLRSGQAPTSALAQVFEAFKKWLRQIYRQASDLAVKLPPEVVEVFDRMVGQDPLTFADTASDGRFSSALTTATNSMGILDPDAINEYFDRRLDVYSEVGYSEADARRMAAEDTEMVRNIQEYAKALTGSYDDYIAHEWYNALEDETAEETVRPLVDIYKKYSRYYSNRNPQMRGEELHRLAADATLAEIGQKCATPDQRYTAQKQAAEAAKQQTSDEATAAAVAETFDPDAITPENMSAAIADDPELQGTAYGTGADAPISVSSELLDDVLTEWRAENERNNNDGMEQRPFGNFADSDVTVQEQNTDTDEVSPEVLNEEITGGIRNESAEEVIPDDARALLEAAGAFGKRMYQAAAAGAARSTRNKTKQARRNARAGARAAASTTNLNMLNYYANSFQAAANWSAQASAELASRIFSPVQEASWWSKRITDLSRKTVDSLAKVKQRFRELFSTEQDADWNSQLINRELALMGPKVDAETQAFLTEVQEPLVRSAQDYARANGLNFQEVLEDFHNYRTLMHTLERNNTYIQNINTMLQDLYQQPPTAENLAQITELQELKDDWLGRQNNTRPDAKVPGGRTMAEAQGAVDALIQRYGLNTLEEHNQMIGGAWEWVTRRLIERGQISQEQVAQFGDWNYYSALTTEQESSSSSPTDMGVYMPKIGYRAEGSVSPAQSGFVSLMQYGLRAAKAVGMADFGLSLYQHYEGLMQRTPVESSNKYSVTHAGLTRIDLDKLNAHIRAVGDGDLREYLQELRNKCGVVTRTAVFDPQLGQTTIKAYGYMFTDAALNQQWRESNITSSGNALVDTMANITRFSMYPVTRLTATFPIRSAALDHVERFFNILNNKYELENGKTVSGGRLSVRMTAFTLNPANLSKVIRFNKMGSSGDTMFDQYMKEFNASGIGAGSNFLEITKAFRKTAIPELTKNMNKLYPQDFMRKTGKAAIKKYNDMVSAIYEFPAQAMYISARRMGMSAKNAARATLQVMNMKQTGTATRTLSAFTPFVVPIMQTSKAVLNAFGINAATFGNTRHAYQQRKNFLKASLTMSGIIASLTTLLPFIKAEFGDGDEDEGARKLDDKPLSSITGWIPIRIGDIDTKLPLGFGFGKIASTIAYGWDRVERNKMSPSAFNMELISVIASSFAPYSGPAFDFNKNPKAWIAHAFSPAFLQPIFDVAANRTYYGTQIDYEKRKQHVPWSDVDRNTTSPVWKDIARTMFDTMGVDMSPESYKALAYGYAKGPIGTLLSAIAEDPMRKDPAYADMREGLGPVWTLLGMNSLARPVSDSYTPSYHRAKEYYDDKLRHAHIDFKIPGKERLDIYDKQRILFDNGWTSEEVDDWTILQQGEANIMKLWSGVSKERRPLEGDSANTAIINQIFAEAFAEDKAIKEAIIRSLNYYAH